MKILNMETIVEGLRNNTISNKSILKYIIIMISIEYLFDNSLIDKLCPTTPRPFPFLVFEDVTSFLFEIVILISAYLFNKKIDDKDFFRRFIAIGTVLLLRFILFIIPMFFVFLLFMAFIKNEYLTILICDFSIIPICILYFYRLRYWFKTLAK